MTEAQLAIVALHTITAALGSGMWAADVLTWSGAGHLSVGAAVAVASCVSATRSHPSHAAADAWRCWAWRSTCA